MAESEEPFNLVDMTVTTTPEVAREVLEDLRSGESVELVLDAEMAGDTPEHIEWQLENEQQIMQFVEDYDGER